MPATQFSKPTETHAAQVFRRNVRRLAAAREMSICELARQCGFAAPNLVGMLNGKHAPSFATVDQIAQVLHAKLSDLFAD